MDACHQVVAETKDTAPSAMVYSLVASGKLRAYRLTTKETGGIRFSEDQMSNFLAASETGAEADPDDDGPLRHL